MMTLVDSRETVDRRDCLFCRAGRCAGADASGDASSGNASTTSYPVSFNAGPKRGDGLRLSTSTYDRLVAFESQSAKPASLGVRSSRKFRRACRELLGQPRLSQVTFKRRQTNWHDGTPFQPLTCQMSLTGPWSAKSLSKRASWDRSALTTPEHGRVDSRTHCGHAPKPAALAFQSCHAPWRRSSTANLAKQQRDNHKDPWAQEWLEDHYAAAVALTRSRPSRGRDVGACGEL